MKRRYRGVLLAILMAVPLVMGPGMVMAQEFQNKPNFEGGIVSCSGIHAQNGLPSCNFCSFVQLIGNMIQYSIYLAVILSALMFAYAGFLFLTNNGKEANITKAWSIFRRALLGTAAILAAWLIVHAIMSELASGLDFEGEWNQIKDCSNLDANAARRSSSDFGSSLPQNTNTIDRVYVGPEFEQVLKELEEFKEPGTEVGGTNVFQGYDDLE